ncbi:MAG TPA: protein-tyrosine-phosphatase [Ruminococcaceae bacterium]|nr:protein-tyrosine-phosphatase [Oscillospiraceae bacterium]
MINRVNKPLRLDGAYNIRELGGYTTVDGKTTKTGVFLRGDGTQSLSDRDLDILNDIGVSLVVDLRSPDEVTEQPSRFHLCEHIRYENVVMFDGLRMFLASEKMPKSMAELYCILLDKCKEQYKRIFGYFLDNKGVSLFHCTAGKDRTGVVAMLLLQLAGVPDDMIIADYSVSENNMSGVFEEQHRTLYASGIEVPEIVFGSRTEDMENTLKYLSDNYGCAESYLLDCGLRQQEISSLKTIFVD